MKGLGLMVAPTGARRSKADHPGLPVTPAECAAAGAACHAAGAGAVHLHVRDAAGLHSLDPTLYRDATARLRAAAGPDLVIQITTEAVGRYTTAQQIDTVRAVEPEAVSIAVKELVPDPSAEPAAAGLYAWARDRRIAVQHIIYTVDELERMLDLAARGVIPGHRHSVIFPLGRYAAGQESDPAELVPLLARLRDSGSADRFDWWVCAFGRAETPSLVAAAALGGHCRIGFENSLVHADGSVASSNEDRLAELRRSLSGVPHRLLGRDEMLRALGRPD